MPIDPFLIEATWKSAGVTKRTAAEKLKFKKTGISEALRAYATAEKLGIERSAEKAAKLKAVKVVLNKCKADHRANTVFVTYLSNMEKGITREVNRLDKEVDALTIDSIMAKAQYTELFRAFCKKEFNLENFDFLTAIKGNVSNSVLFQKYVSESAPNSINIKGPTRVAWTEAEKVKDAGKILPCKLAAYKEIHTLLTTDTLPRFKASLHIKV